MAIMSYNGNDDLSTAQQFIEQETALFRHYRIDEVQLVVRQFTGVSLSSEEAINLVQNIRDTKGLGPIAEHALPGYEEEEAPTGQQTKSRWKFW